jgi:hypothetical protein
VEVHPEPIRNRLNDLNVVSATTCTSSGIDFVPAAISRRRCDEQIDDLSRMFNPVLRGWGNYYG